MPKDKPKRNVKFHKKWRDIVSRQETRENQTTTTQEQLARERHFVLQYELAMNSAATGEPSEWQRSVRNSAMDRFTPSEPQILSWNEINKLVLLLEWNDPKSVQRRYDSISFDDTNITNDSRTHNLILSEIYASYFSLRHRLLSLIDDANQLWMAKQKLPASPVSARHAIYVFTYCNILIQDDLTSGCMFWINDRLDSNIVDYVTMCNPELARKFSKAAREKISLQVEILISFFRLKARLDLYAAIPELDRLGIQRVNKTLRNRRIAKSKSKKAKQTQDLIAVELDNFIRQWCRSPRRTGRQRPPTRQEAIEAVGNAINCNRDGANHVSYESLDKAVKLRQIKTIYEQAVRSK